MISNELMEKLQKAIARELQVSIQYMWQHVLAKGIKAEPVGVLFRQFAINEMLHAEKIAERISFYGGIPTTQPDPITLGKNLKEMIEIDKKAEEEAVSLYKQIIRLAEKEEDFVTRKLFEQILEEEEGHLDKFSSLLEE
ncbi:MAG TPA: ferritin-like domain-containing protein [Thermodesulfovibrio thiophilus]|uniref:ferritin-like domain-containing protein n=1 Tax=Thermodesulfovibrio thiophilus TaxID=340095 RepID=UPI0003FD09B5|nr:ferritin-like domain-containing protein [Thermodesulfovibrio thiophilus]HHW20216.1 ferritin [Thermodesulfovibrio thiophilus]HOA83015.1 ferritin-like domain-containing protein [Thermodesulfovibrio thiophilus]HQA03485.1 ferritin-like domain-containing protein [Thermodesulfovibrio thiophilus]HQD36090.1 ferritin-like domain-containing protein [Thermodesulfovibrio thiophilus]